MNLTPKDWAEYQHYKTRDPVWIKLHRKLLNNYDFHRLPVASRALAPMLWLLASEYEGGIIAATLAEIAFRLHMTEAEVAEALNPLLEAKFFTSDSKPLARRKHVAIPEKETETQVKTETDLRAVATATRPDGRFDEFMKVYPKRRGANPTDPARKKWDAAIKVGVDPGKIIKAIKSGIGFDPEKIGTEFIPRASTWLSEGRWKDYRECEERPEVAGFYAAFGSPQLDAWDATKPGGYPRDKNGGWRFPTEWPPGHKQEAA